MEIASIAEALKSLVSELAINVVANLLVEHWVVVLAILLGLRLAFFGWPLLRSAVARWEREIWSGARSRVRELKREGVLNPELSTDQAVETLWVGRRAALKKISSVTGAAVVALMVVDRVTRGVSIEGILQSAGRNQASILVVCTSKTTGQMVSCVRADDSGYFKVAGLAADDYSLFAYRHRKSKDTVEWLHMYRTVGLFENQHLGTLEFPKKAGHRTAFDAVTFQSETCVLIDAADYILTQIKLRIVQEKPGVLIIEGLTSDAAGDDGKFDNHALACARCDFVHDFLGPAARHWLVIKIPRIPDAPRKVDSTHVSRAERSAVDPQRSVRIVMLT
ncbi:MAG TPA: hypothetical protein VD994_13040 [Prosthecobacter sp.]|nr:hypothetical protein [Prosthecobacter sp.]